MLRDGWGGEVEGEPSTRGRKRRRGRVDVLSSKRAPYGVHLFARWETSYFRLLTSLTRFLYAVFPRMLAASKTLRGNRDTRARLILLGKFHSRKLRNTRCFIKGKKKHRGCCVCSNEK